MYSTSVALGSKLRTLIPKNTNNFRERRWSTKYVVNRNLFDASLIGLPTGVLSFVKYAVCYIQQTRQSEQLDCD